MIWALYIFYALAFIDIIITAYKHGETRPDYNLWITLISKAIFLVLIWWALGWRFI